MNQPTERTKGNTIWIHVERDGDDAIRACRHPMRAMNVWSHAVKGGQKETTYSRKTYEELNEMLMNGDPPYEIDGPPPPPNNPNVHKIKPDSPTPQRQKNL